MAGRARRISYVISRRRSSVLVNFSAIFPASLFENISLGARQVPTTRPGHGKGVATACMRDTYIEAMRRQWSGL
jgi:hypothetical protein